MAGAKGSALEWALALMQAPGERHALRQRPLPDGVDALLSIASGTRSSPLAEAVADTGLDEATLREAARFYAREILFFPQADPYRVLGVPADADADAIRAHHRLLQQWLHPDRQQNVDDAVFAARINMAWNQLRTPALRAAYDAGRATDACPPPVASTAREAVGWIATPVEAVAEPARWQRWPAMVFGVACLVLVALVLVEADRPPPSVALASGDAEPKAAGEEGFGFSVPALRKAVAAIKRTASPPVAPPRAAQRQAPLADAANRALPSGASLARAPTALPEPLAPVMLATETPPQELPADPDPPRPAILPEAMAEQRVPASPPADARQAGSGQASHANEPAASPAHAPDPGRVRLARQVGAQLVDFVAGKRRAAPPIWNSPAAQGQAMQAHANLRVPGRVSAGEPDWRVGQDSAELRVRFEAGGVPAVMMRAKLAWRAEQWLVTGVDMEPLQ